MKEYRISKGWGIFIYISASVLIVFFTWMICLPFIENKEIDLGLYLFLWPMFIGMIVIMALGIIETYKGKFVIAADHIYVVGTFSTKKLYLEEINGFRKIDSYIYIIPISKEQKTIKISTYYKNQDEIEHWLNAHLIDLNLVDEHIERQEILADENTRGAYINHISQHNSEYEFLLPTNTKLEILDVIMTSPPGYTKAYKLIARIVSQ